MQEIVHLEKQIDKIGHDHELLKFENDALKARIEELKEKNEMLERKNQDMLLQIDSVLSVSKGSNG